MSSLDQLIVMANDIGHYFKSEPEHAAAVDGIADHIHTFWDPRMRRQILAHLEAGGKGLEPLPKEALEKLAESATAKPS